MSISNLFAPNNYHIYSDIEETNNVYSNESANTVTNSITAAGILAGIAVVSVTAGAVTCQLPTAANLVAAFSGIKVGNVIKCLFVASGTTNSLILQGGSGVTLQGTPTIGPQTSRLVYFRFTNISSGTETIAVY
jgi:hypothetical protein